MPHNITEIYLHKLAVDAGFEILVESAESAGWSSHRSCRFSLEVWACILPQGVVLALSKVDILEKLREELPDIADYRDTLPPAAVGAVLADSGDSLYALLMRIGQLELSLPHRIAEAFTQQTIDMPRQTEAERLVVQRVGQDKLRHGLLEYWCGACMVTGLGLPEVLRASHIKPWKDCDNDHERLNIYNALLLAPHLDALFDKGFISFADDGAIELSPHLTSEHRQKLSVHSDLAINRVEQAHLPFLHYHRERIFKK